MSRIFAKIFQHSNFDGEYRWITEDVDNIGSQLGFNDKVSSIIVYRGNHYRTGDSIRFYEHSNKRGGYLDLEPGHYKNIHVQPFSFGDKISSIDLNPSSGRQPNLTVRLVVRVYEHVNFQGQYRDILLNENNFNKIGFNDKVSSLAVYRGEDYLSGYVCNFFQHGGTNGGLLQPGDFGPNTQIRNLKAAPYVFNDVISSIEIKRI